MRHVFVDERACQFSGRINQGVVHAAISACAHARVAYMTSLTAGELLLAGDIASLHKNTTRGFTAKECSFGAQVVCVAVAAGVTVIADVAVLAAAVAAVADVAAVVAVVDVGDAVDVAAVAVAADVAAAAVAPDVAYVC